MSVIKVGSLFDGIGGTPLSAVMAGAEPVWASEIEKWPISITKRHFPSMKHLGDITQINGAEIEPVDIIVGGSPCQDLSVAGKREGLDGERSGLFMDQCRIIKEMRNATKQTDNGSTEFRRPRYMVWENVPGAFSSNKGEDFRAVLEEVARIADDKASIPGPPKGKWLRSGTILGDRYSISWRTVDAQHWGVPQRRRRVYLVADFGGHTAPEICFERESVSGNFETSGEATEGAAGDAEGSSGSSGELVLNDQAAVCYSIGGFNSEGMKSSNPHSGVYEAETSRTIDRNGGNPACNQGGITVVQSLYENHGTDSRVTGPLDVSPTATQRWGTGGNNTPLVHAYSTQSYSKVKESEQGASLKASGGTYGGGSENYVVQGMAGNDQAATLLASYASKQGLDNQHVDQGCPNFIQQQQVVRRLTPLECERLQGFPDGWTQFSEDGKEISDTQRYKALGNSFAVPNAYFFISRCVQVLNGQDPNGVGDLPDWIYGKEALEIVRGYRA